MQGGDVGVLFTSPHGYITLDSPATDLGDRCFQRGDVDISGVFSAGNEFGCLTGRWMPGKGKQPRETQRTLHILAPEGKCGNYTVGTGTTTYMR